MNTLVTVIIAVLVFGFLIFIHEFGHFIFARIFKVTVNEFSIGMGPRLLWYDSKKSGTKYSLSMLPIGGFVAMAGEDSESDDPNSFDKKPAWQRFIITAAGATVNIVFGFVAMILLTCLINIGSTTVAEFKDPAETKYEVSSMDSGLMEGDTVVAINGSKVAISDELSYLIMRYGHEPVSVTVIRNGETKVLENVVFPTVTDQGQTLGMQDFKVYRVEKSFGKVMEFSWRKSCLIVRMVWESIYDLISGRFSFSAVSGPVGISDAIGNAARAGFTSLLYMVVLISINLGVMNLLPIPALDGGRLITIIIEMITRRKLPQKIEGAINAAGLTILLGLSFVIMIKDIIQLAF